MDYLEAKTDEGKIVLKVLWRMFLLGTVLTLLVFTVYYAVAAWGYYRDSFYAAWATVLDIKKHVANTIWLVKDLASKFMNMFIEHYMEFVQQMKFPQPCPEPSKIAWNASVQFAMIFVLPGMTFFTVLIPSLFVLKSIVEWVGLPMFSRPEV
jgi:hypothetical protein